MTPLLLRAQPLQGGAVLLESPWTVVVGGFEHSNRRYEEGNHDCMLEDHIALLADR